MRLFRSLMGLTAVAAVAWASVPAQAVPMLRLSDGVNSVTITDQLAGDANPTGDLLVWMGSIGTWQINVTTGLSERVPRIHLDLNSLNGSFASGAGGTLEILFTDTDFSLTGASTAGLAVGGVTSGSVEFATYYDPANIAFNTTGSAVQLGSTLLGSGAFSSGTTGVLPVDGQFSLTQRAVITHPGAGTTSFNYELIVPEPGLLAMMGVALLALGLVWRRRLRTQPSATP